MPFISYAQNGEDVMLWRAFGGISQGFYVDVGAAHPDEDSVTRAFYDRGWCGINVEPVPALAARIAAARPRDVTLAVAAGALEGTAALHCVFDTGLSTIDDATAALLSNAGFQPETINVPLRRLGAILAEHAPDEVHFLKVDVEGAEAAVLEGADFNHCRPRIVLVEATRPLSSVLTHAAWEPLLLNAGYRFVFFDGLNRFYVADEWHDLLTPHFAAPVNVLDDYIRISDAAWARAAAAQEAQIRLATARAEAAEAAAHAAYAHAFEQARDTGVLRSQLEAAAQAKAEAERLWLAADAWGHECDARTRDAEARMAQAEAHTSALAASFDAKAAELDAKERLLQAVHVSTSWRITRPVRALASFARRNPVIPPSPSLQSPSPRPTPGPVPMPQQPASVPSSPEPSHPGPPTVVGLPAPAPAPGTTLACRDRRHGTLRAVHQFHSGSATGDAVTNCMLLIRHQLRALGYRSEIFVEHRDPALAHELRPLSSLPADAGHALILHHSMGHDALDAILAHPAPKVLYYHNITPAEFLPLSPSLRHYAGLGRKQLQRLRGQVLAALAASEYSAIELRRAGFDPVSACSLLFDLDVLRGNAPDLAPRAPQHPFTILFVGRVIKSKAQADLIDAFAQFRTAFPHPTRLVLVGRTDSPGAYLQTIDDRMRAHALEAHVVLTGAVPDAELHAQYRAADLYVSLSHHEGFGVPLVEAVAYGVPVLAWPCGAVPYTLGDPVGLLTSRDPADVADRMLALANDASRRTVLAAAQRAALDRFALPRQWPAMQDALARAGVALPPGLAAREALAAQLCFTVEGHAQGSYSLAAVNRSVAAAIDAERPGRVRLVPVEGARTADFSVLPVGARQLAERPPLPTGPNVVISQHYPIYVPPDPGDLCLALVFWEESLFPPDMIATLAAGFEAVLTPSRFVAKALLDSGLPLPVRVVGQAPDLSAFERVARERKPRDAGPFTFLHVSSCFPRKGVDVLLAAYARAFRRSDPVRLVIKGFPNPHNAVLGQVAALQAADPDVPTIEIIDRDLHDEDILALFRNADAMVLPTRGEGLNLPAAEAMASGLPLIVTGLGGHMDFADSGTARLLSYRLAPSESHLASPNSLWAEPDQDDLVSALQEVEQARHEPVAAARLAARTGRARVQVALRLGARAMVRRLEQTALDLLLRPPPEPLRVAWVTSWGVRCGVAEYSRHLLAALPPEPAIAALVVLSDDRTPPETADAPRFRPAWNLALPCDIERFENAVVAEDPQVVVIQHQPGLIPWAGLAGWLASPVLRGRVVVITLHNTKGIADLPEAARAKVCAALEGVDRVMVHTRDDLDRLQGQSLAANVALLPHGVPDFLPPRPAREPGAAPLIGCYGFFLPGKGIDVLIEVLAILRQTRPGARLRLVNADYGVQLSSEEIARCRALAETAGLVQAIEWETRFLADSESLALLAACDAVVLPTQTSEEASSAAVRTALTAGVPVMVTPLPIFANVSGTVVRSRGFTPGELAESLDALLSDPVAQAEVQQVAQLWLRAHHWSAIACRFQNMLRGLAASRTIADET